MNALFHGLIGAKFRPILQEDYLAADRESDSAIRRSRRIQINTIVPSSSYNTFK